MNRLRLIALLLMSLSTLSAQKVPVSAEEGNITVFGPTGSELLQRCSDYGRFKVGESVATEQLAAAAKNVGLCEGYILGIYDGMTTYATAVHQNQIACLPKRGNMDQLIRVIKKSLEENPSQLHLPSSALVVRALTDAFPCK